MRHQIEIEKLNVFPETIVHTTSPYISIRNHNTFINISQVVKWKNRTLYMSNTFSTFFLQASRSQERQNGTSTDNRHCWKSSSTPALPFLRTHRDLFNSNIFTKNKKILEYLIPI